MSDKAQIVALTEDRDKFRNGFQTAQEQIDGLLTERARLTEALEQAKRERDEAQHHRDLKEGERAELRQLLTEALTTRTDERDAVIRDALKFKAERDQQAGALVTLREAVQRMVDKMETDGVPGYIYDAQKAECVECGATAPTIAEVKHVEDCYQAHYEVLRVALAASAPAFTPEEG
jgi:chromosome segregation ATPase